MLDLEMFAQLARPSGAYAGPPPPALEEVFQRVVAGGWAPRNPAFGEELTRLQVSTTRGDCLEPLILEGDEVFIDRDAKPLPGDLVSFALSQRGADAQNTPPVPADHRPRRKGDRWIKLYVPWHGFEMLLEKYGSAATATLLACEHPDDSPVLWPVRNIRRQGRLLFAPSDVICSQINLNAVTVLNYATDDSTYATGFGGTAVSATYPGSSFAVPYASSPILNFTATESQAVIVTATGTIYFSNTSPATLVSRAWIGVLLLDTSTGNTVVTYSPQAGVGHGFYNISCSGTTVSPTPTQQFAFQTEANITKGHTYAVLLFIQTGASQVTAETTSVQLQVETIKR